MCQERSAIQYTEPRFVDRLMLMVEIGERLRALRNAQGLSYRRLSEQVDISYNALAAYEKGREMPSFLNVVKLCRYFNVPLEYFITGEERPFEYQDVELVELFTELDRLPDPHRALVKSYARRVVSHASEELALRREAQEKEETENNKSGE